MIQGGGGLIGMRIRGVLLALTCLALLLVWVRLLFRDSGWRHFGFRVVCGILALGVTPWVFSLARPEQWMVLGMAVLLVCHAMNRAPATYRFGSQMACVIASVGAISLFYYMHPKALLFTPFIAALVYLTWYGKNKLLAASLVGMAAFAAWQTFIDASLSRCDEAPLLKEALNAYALKPADFLSAPVNTLVQAAENLLASWRASIEHAGFSNSYQSDWLPRMALTERGFAVAATNSAVAFLLGALPLVAIFLLGVATAIGLRGGWRNQSIILAFLLLAGVLAQAATYNGTWYFYNNGLALPAFAMVFVLLASGTPALRPSPWQRSGSLILALTGAASTLLLLILLVPALLSINASPTPRLPNQDFSTQARFQSQQFADIRQLARACGLRMEGEKSLMIDDASYHAFTSLVRPVHVFYVSEFTVVGADLEGRLGSFMSGQGSRGFILRCDYVPRQLANQVLLRHAGYCCGRFLSNP
jgi:hypothetical protein